MAATKAVEPIGNVIQSLIKDFGMEAVLNEAAKLLLGVAPPPIGQVVLETCEHLNIKPWHLYNGHLLKADQRAELHAPLLLEEWTSTGPVGKEPTVTGGTKTCPSCKRGFIGPENRPEAKFCCNYCGSGRYQRDQTHHQNCEFYIKPKQYATIPGRAQEFNPEVVPEDPASRLEYEINAMKKHQLEVNAAEQTLPGLPPLPGEEAFQRDATATWHK